MEYFGFGIGAASFIKNERYSNISDIDEYMEILNKSHTEDTLCKLVAENAPISKSDAMAEFFYLGLRRMEGVYFEDFRKISGEDVYSIYGDVIEKLVNQGLLEYIYKDNKQTAAGVRLTTEGIFVSNAVFVEFV